MITVEKDNSVLARWKRWGIGFNVEPSPEPCGLEGLLVDTAEELGSNARLYVMVATWLVEHHAIVDTERLAELALHLHGEASAGLGLLLETAQERIGEAVFANVIAACHPVESPRPLYAFLRNRTGLSKLSESTASEASRKWGLWTQRLDRLKPESLRPASWIAKHNEAFCLRTLLKGDVRSRVLTALREEGQRNVSETDLTRRAGCTRKAMHSALDNLEQAGLITRKLQGRKYTIMAT